MTNITWNNDRANGRYLFAPQAITLGFPEHIARDGYPREDISRLRIPEALFRQHVCI